MFYKKNDPIWWRDHKVCVVMYKFFLAWISLFVCIPKFSFWPCKGLDTFSLFSDKLFVTHADTKQWLSVCGHCRIAYCHKYLLLRRFMVWLLVCCKRITNSNELGNTFLHVVPVKVLLHFFRSLLRSFPGDQMMCWVHFVQNVLPQYFWNSKLFMTTRPIKLLEGLV